MTVPWMVIAYLVIFAIILIVLVRMTTKARNAQPVSAESENPREGMLLRFIENDQGTRLGETVALEGDDFIVKDAKGFLAVPAATVREEGKGLRLTAAYDEAQARQKGEAWRSRSHKVITYSDTELPKEDPEG